MTTDRVSDERLRTIIKQGSWLIWISADGDELFSALSELLALRAAATTVLPIGEVTDDMVDAAFNGYLAVMGIPYEPGNPHPKVALRAALVAALTSLKENHP